MDIPGASPSSTASQSSNIHFTSFGNSVSSSSKKKILISIIILLATILAVLIYTISQKRSVKSKAACNIEHMPPYNVLPGCLDEDAETDCPAPGDGQCKPKGSPCGADTCWECRTSEGLKFIQFRDGQWGSCGGEPTQPPPPPTEPPAATEPPPTPTTPPAPTATPKPEICEPPNKCIPKSQIPQDQLNRCIQTSPQDSPCKNPEELCCDIQPSPTPSAKPSASPTPSATPTLPPGVTPTPTLSCPLPKEVEDLQIYCPSCTRF